MQNLIELDEIS